jgi:hypothetical protein
VVAGQTVDKSILIGDAALFRLKCLGELEHDVSYL